MALVNVSLDDMSPLLFYNPYSAWHTNNATNQLWSNTSYFEGTYHETSIANASVSVNVTGNFSLYGAMGPSYGSWAIAIDGAQVQTGSAYATSGSTRALYYSSGPLSRGTHNVTVTALGARQANEGSGLLIDRLDMSALVGAAGATLQNQTINQNDSRISYSSPWTTNYNAVFIDGDTSYTNINSSLSFRFNGSAIYAIGDHLDDHGLYVVSLDGQNVTLDGRVPTPDFKVSTMFFAADLNASEHTITIANIAPGFFDLDAFIVTVPSAYETTAANNSSSAVASAAATAPSASASTAAKSAGSRILAGPDALLSLLSLWLVLLLAFKRK